MTAIAIILQFLLASAVWAGNEGGAGFGQTLRPLFSARQAGTGDIALEDMWRNGALIEANTVLLDQGLKWMGLGAEAGVGSIFRANAELFSFSSSDVTKTYEKSDGTYGGTNGTEKVDETGGRVTGKLEVWKSDKWTIKAVGRMNGLFQSLPGMKTSGYAMEAGAQGEYRMGTESSLLAWGLGGPLGRGAQRGFANQWTVGSGIYGTRPKGWLADAEGYGAGFEASFLGEGLFNGNLGAVYWFGRPDVEGGTWFIRGGTRYSTGSIMSTRFQGGAGALWTWEDGGGLEFDLALVPLGGLGYFKYLTMTYRFPKPAPVNEVTPVEPAVPPANSSKPALSAGDKTKYFLPSRGQKAAVDVHVSRRSILSAQLLDMDGKHLMTLRSGDIVDPGNYRIEWDGSFGHGAMAKMEVPYIIRVTYNNMTMDVRTIPVNER